MTGRSFVIYHFPDTCCHDLKGYPIYSFIEIVTVVL